MNDSSIVEYKSQALRQNTSARSSIKFERESSPENSILTQLKETLFGRFESDALNDIASQARFEYYKSQVVIQAAGTLPTVLRLVVQGHIKLLTTTRVGKEVCLSQIGPGGWATWLPCLIPAATSYDLCSATDSIYIAISAQRLREFCEKHPKIYPLILSEVNQRMDLLISWVGQASLMPQQQRLAMLIYLLARDQKVIASNGILNVNQNRLAELCGHSRQTVNHLLGELESQGLLAIEYGRLVIPSLALLSAYAEMSD